MAKKQNIKDQVKTYEDAFAIVKAMPKLPEWISSLVQKEAEDVPKWLRIFIIAKALNGNWTPDWNNSNEYKYYPWFRMRDGFSYLGYSYGDARTDVGSRLCYKSSELAEYAGKQFEDLYKEYMTV